MSRLYYDKGPGASGGLREGAGGPPPRGGNPYLEKVAKLVLTEVVVGYVTLIGLVPLITVTGQVWLYLVAFVLGLVLTPLYLNYQAEAGRPKKTHLIVSTIAFVVWAYAVSGPTTVPGWYNPAAASFVLVAFSLISGVIPLR
jgi:hypothetical protein